MVTLSPRDIGAIRTFLERFTGLFERHLDVKPFETFRGFHHLLRAAIKKFEVLRGNHRVLHHPHSRLNKRDFMGISPPLVTSNTELPQTGGTFRN